MVQKNAVRQDLLRGVRWGAILLIVMLLGIAAYRVIGSGRAVASIQPSQPESDEEFAVPEIAVKPDAALKVGDPVLKGPDAPPPPRASPAPTRRQNATTAPQARTLTPSPERISSRFAPTPVATPKPKPDAFASTVLPEADASATARDIEGTGPATVPALNDPASDSKQGNRATRIARSVGRIFRIGRKDASPSAPASK
jgi:hypothetical protein